MKKKVFVYGTLKSGHGNSKYFLENDESVCLGKCTIDGNFTMVNLGAFPGVIPTGNNTIHGEVWEVSEKVSKRLDRLEGYDPDPNQRYYDKMVVETAFGNAEIYILDESHLNYPKIETGEW